MPKDLVALLSEEGAVTVEALQRALERQRALGGALDTALLEEEALPEAALVGYLARAAELPTAPEEAWVAADARARRVFPSRVAERHGLAPFALDGRELSLVATYPVDLGLLDEISFMLSLHLTAHVGPEWRVRELVHRLYGSPLAPRLAALAAAAGSLASTAAAAGEPLPPEPPGSAGEPGDDAVPPPPPPLTGFERDDAEPLEPLAAALQLALEAADPSLFEAEGEAGAEGFEEEAGPEPERAPPDRSAPPRWRLEDARAALAAARDRDEVVLTAIRYARDFFEYAAVFAVTRDAVAGHDALGAEDERDRARSIAIWASDPGIMKTVIETRSPFLGPVSREAAGNEVILAGLGRGTPRTALVHPVLLRDRPVCVVYADNGEAPVSARRLGDLLLFLSTLGNAFERIIRDRKRRRRRSAPPASPLEEASPGGAAEPMAAPPEERPPPEAPREPEPRAESEASAEAAPAPAPTGDPPAGVELPLDPPAFVAAAKNGPRAPAPAGEEPVPTGVEEALASVDVDLGDVASAPDPAWAAGPASEAAPNGGAALPVGPPAADSLEALDALEERFFLGPDDGEDGAAALARPPPSPSAAPPRGPSWPDATPPEPGPAPESPPVARPPEPASFAALADRALEADPTLSQAAREALAEHRRHPGMRPASEKLRRALLSGISVRSTRAAHAIGALRDVEAIPLLIQVLETSDPETARAAAEALATITLQRIGPDARGWLAWWKENRGRGRAEWLFSGLTSPDRETRVAAAEELALAAEPPVAYSADLPAADRERLARAWAGWWARSGQVL